MKVGIVVTLQSALFLVLTALLSPGQAEGADLGAGQKIYAAQCAVCHGASGRPDPDSPVVKGLGVMPADFSDPLFNSREPAGDWEMVIKYGGHALGLAEQMPAQGEALSDEDIANVTAYIKSRVDTVAYPPGEMNLFLPTRTKKAFPEDEVVYKGRFTDQDGDNSQKHVLEIEKRIGKAGQAIVELVYESEGDVSELAEAEIGYKQALSFSQQHILSAAAVWAIPVEAQGDGELQTRLRARAVGCLDIPEQPAAEVPVRGRQRRRGRARGHRALGAHAVAATHFSRS